MGTLPPAPATPWTRRLRNSAMSSSALDRPELRAFLTAIALGPVAVSGRGRHAAREKVTEQVKHLHKRIMGEPGDVTDHSLDTKLSWR